MSEEISTIIYGGAFCPPTKAHQSVLQACTERATRDDGEVWLLPSGNRRDKHSQLSIDDRLALCHALVASIRSERIRVVDIELRRKKLTETIDTIQQFDSEYPDRDFTWVFGMDSVQTMPQWRGGGWILDNVSMLVVPRMGSMHQALGRRAELLDMTTMATSSTEVRIRLQHRQPINDLVPRSVERCIRAKELQFAPT